MFWIMVFPEFRFWIVREFAVRTLAVAVWVVDGPFGVTSPAARSGLLFLFNIPVLALVFRVLDRGRLIRGSSIHAPAPASRPARAA